jgi:penicillin-binding protein-related factor A (putative recombinase)
MPLTEAELTKQIRDWLDANHIWHYKHWQGSRRGRSGRKGVSDIIGIYKGKFMAIEVKTSKAALRPEQAQFLGEVAQQYAIAIVARSLEDVIEGLRVQGK